MDSRNPLIMTAAPLRFKWTKCQLHISYDGPFRDIVYVLELHLEPRSWKITQLWVQSFEEWIFGIPILERCVRFRASSLERICGLLPLRNVQKLIYAIKVSKSVSGPYIIDFLTPALCENKCGNVVFVIWANIKSGQRLL